MGKISFSLIMIVIILILIYFLGKKYKLNRNQKIIFWLLVLFWSSIIIIREYRKIYAATEILRGGLGLSAVMASQITAAYGLVSLLIRTPIFFLTDIFQKRSVFIRLALVFTIVTGILVSINPSFNTLYLSSISMGVSASMLAIFNVMFSYTFTKSKASVSASILAVAPLLAEFLVAPIQYIFTHNEYKDFYILWIISVALAIITLILSFFMEDIKSNVSFSKNKLKKVITHKKFLIACFIAIIISFVKFSTSVNNMIYYSKTYLNMPSIMLAYLGPLFSMPQLIASVLIGTYFNKRFGIEKTLILSLSLLALFNLIVITSNNYIVVFSAYILNGFGYGATYVSLISMAMEYFDMEDRNISMGVFQAFFAFGIFFGQKIYVILSKSLLKESKLIFIIVFIILIISLFVTILSLILNNNKKMKKE